jgi:hypothetical protein
MLGSAGVSKELQLGRVQRNALPLRASALQEENYCSSGDDDSGTYGGQVFMYVSNTVGDLANGSLYMMKEQTTTKRKIWL